MPVNPKKHEAMMKAFCAAYLSNGHNGTKAYIKLRPGSTTENAKRRAFDLLAKEDYQEEIRRLEENFLEEQHITTSRTLQEFATIGYEPLGKAKSKERRQALKDIGTVKVQALDKLAKALHLYDSELPPTGEMGIDEGTPSIIIKLPYNPRFSPRTRHGNKGN
jgi:Terminase small subunit.